MLLSPSDTRCLAQVGSDPRLTGPLLRSAISAGLVSKGARVADFGLATTPAMFMSCILPGGAHTLVLPVACYQPAPLLCDVDRPSASTFVDSQTLYAPAAFDRCNSYPPDE